jgi:DNA-binding transcriptional ArsR family regulator
MQTVTHSDALSRFGRALSDPTRAEILLMLRDAPGYPSDLAEKIGVTRQILSNHLACLRGCGLVTASREGRQVRYELADQRLAGALRELARVVLDSPACPAHLEPRP